MATKVICPHCSAEYDESKGRRDRFAAAALTGLLSCEQIADIAVADRFAMAAVKYADALIAELDKEQP